MAKAKKRIATRWFVNSFSIVAIIMLIAIIATYLTARSYYYSSVSQYLNSEANLISEVLNRYFEDSPASYANEIRDMVECFDKRNLMELVAIDKNGKPKISSSGFSPATDIEMPDYETAMTDGTGRGSYMGRSGDGGNSEKYMAVTVTIRQGNSDYTAIRLITGLEKVDARLMRITAVALMIAVVVLLLMLALGFYFIASIVSPIKEMSNSAKQLARGNFKGRIKVKRNDEIGDLCLTFNQMASELENTEKIKNDFISSVSHELRTPLTAIKGWSETIMEVRDEETLAKGMRVIMTETQRLSDMVEELLDFSRIQNNNLQLQKTNMDVLAELADAVLIYTERAAKSGISINYNEPQVPVIICGDKNRLKQVFINIIDNAVKYSKSGGTIDVDAYLNNSRIEIRISDDGCGISKEDLPKVKTRFYKANNTVRGSGIGLAVADELIGQHGGTLEIESELGKGTAVIIDLPLIQKKQ